MYAIIEEFGGQRRVTQGEEFLIDLQDGGEAKVGSNIAFDKVLVVGKEGGDAKVGQPYVQGASVKVEVLEALVKGDKIELKDKLYFATKKTQILPKSLPTLNEIADVLRKRPTAHVRIEGHTDDVGSDKFNKKLSDGRAQSVRTYLIGQGIAPERLEAIGYGEERPIEDNKTEDGRSANRRVEFFITKQ